MTAEESAEPEDVRIIDCEPPRLLRMVLAQGPDGWHVDLTLDESDGVTTLRFTQRVGDDLDVSDVGPGWEYYLDRLVAARADAPMPEWGEDYLGQAEHYVGQQAAAR
jgi:hypothetical protein